MRQGARLQGWRGLMRERAHAAQISCALRFFRIVLRRLLIIDLLHQRSEHKAHPGRGRSAVLRCRLAQA